MMERDGWEEGDELEKTHTMLEQYFTRKSIDDSPSPSTSSPVVQPKELSLNQLSREELASLSKEELIELLTNSKKQRSPKRKSKSPHSRKPRNRKRNNPGMAKTRSQSNIDENRIARLSSYANPSDSQSEQPSEQRNANIMRNPLPPEQEERETPKSEPESSDDQHRRRNRALTTNDALLSSTDTIDISILEKKVRTQDPVVFEDISALERSVNSPRSDDDERLDTITSTDESQVILPTLRTNSMQEHAAVVVGEKTNINENLAASAELSKPKSRSRRKRSSSKKTKGSKSGPIKPSKRKKRSTSEVTPSVQAGGERLEKPEEKLDNVPQETESTQENSEKSRIDVSIEKPEDPEDPEESEKKEDSKELSERKEQSTQSKDDKIVEPELPSGAESAVSVENSSKKCGSVSFQKIDKVKEREVMKEPIVDGNVNETKNEKSEEDDETDDSYDIDEEMTEGIMFPEDKKKSKSQKYHIKPGSQKSVKDLLAIVGGVAVSDEEILEAKEKVEAEPFITREGSDDPRRYVELSKRSNISQKMLVGRQIESPTGLRIKENLKAQQLRRFISVGSGLDKNIVSLQLKEKQAESVPSTPEQSSPDNSIKEDSSKNE